MSIIYVNLHNHVINTHFLFLLHSIVIFFFKNLQLIKYGCVILFNVTMWGCYINSLKALSSLQATVTNFATNFLSSGLAGFLLFQEPLPIQVICEICAILFIDYRMILQSRLLLSPHLFMEVPLLLQCYMLAPITIGGIFARCS